MSIRYADDCACLSLPREQRLFDITEVNHRGSLYGVWSKLAAAARWASDNSVLDIDPENHLLRYFVVHFRGRHVLWIDP